MGDPSDSDQRPASGSPSGRGAVRPRRWAGVVALALLGLALTAGITLAANSLVSQPIGLSSEPATVGDSLAPASQQVAPAPVTSERPRTVTRTVTVPAGTTTTAPAETPAPATTTDDDDRREEHDEEDRSGPRGGEEREDDDD